MIWLIISMTLVASGGLGVWGFLSFNPHFGGRISAEEKKRFSNSKQWNGKEFLNEIETKMDFGLADAPAMIKAQMTDRHLRKPATPLPVLPFPEKAKLEYSDLPAFVWLGHSALFLRLAGQNILIDPMLGPDAAPIAPFSTSRFSENTLDLIEKMPDIDLVLLTHDHYDHLDLESIKRLIPKTKEFIVPLGVARHLIRWGVPESQVRELDWWDSCKAGSIDLTFTPTRHFSGRGATDRGHSLWGGFVLETESHRIFWSGDSGFGPHFEKIGEKFGDFDWAFMENGQYNEKWHAIHMYPEESVKAGVQVGAKIAIPVHWGGFDLSLHPWKEPIERFMKAADAEGLTTCTPRLGALVRLGDELAHQSAWWEDFD